MTTTKLLTTIAALTFALACATPPARASSIVYACTDATGTRTSWAGSVAECPTNTRASPTKLIDPCLDLPEGASCACTRDVQTPPDTQTYEYMCCEDVDVCGEIDCYIVTSAIDCQGDYLLWECTFGITHPDGSVECYP